MKSPYLLPAVTALLGFSAAWIVKPGASPAPAAAQVEDTAPNRQARAGTNSRPSAADNKRPKEVKAGDFPLADLAEQGPKSREEAKMLRLTEALGLSIDQQGSIIKLVEDIQATATDTVPVLEDLTTRGRAVEEGLAKVLTPEQLAKFQELRARERDNRIELRSQKMLTRAIEDIDLSPEQRDEVLGRLRQKSRADLQAIPAAATLLFDKSMLPTANKELSEEGVLMLAQMDVPVTDEDPMVAHRKVIDHQRLELEEILRCFDGILTAGQMGQYQAVLSETREILKRLPANANPPPGP